MPLEPGLSINSLPWHSVCIGEGPALEARMTTRNAERLAQIETEARRMARSGAYYGFREIEARLLERGYLEAAKLFANPWTQQEIDRFCYLSRGDAASHPLCPQMQHPSHFDAR